MDPRILVHVWNIARLATATIIAVAVVLSCGVFLFTGNLEKVKNLMTSAEVVHLFPLLFHYDDLHRQNTSSQLDKGERGHPVSFSTHLSRNSCSDMKNFYTPT